MADLDSDRLELLERQLAERVTERVRSSLFKLYAAVGAAVIAALGFVGWDLVADIKSDVMAEISGQVERDVQAKREEITERVAETRIIARRANEVIQRVEDQLDAFEPQAKSLDETIEKVSSLNTTSQDLIDAYSRELQPLVNNVESLRQRLVELAEQVDELNALVSDSGGGTEPAVATTAQRSAAIQSVIADSKAAGERFEQARSRTTVFFQFAEGRRDQAEALSAALAADGYIVPGEDRESGAAAKHEVRYFHEGDEAAARRLAQDATRALRSLGYPPRAVPDVEVNPLVAYAGKKPRPGVLELWLEIPPR
jgi:archaellum component FlaC